MDTSPYVSFGQIGRTSKKFPDTIDVKNSIGDIGAGFIRGLGNSGIGHGVGFILRSL